MKDLEEYAKKNKIPIMQKDGILYLINYIKENNIENILDIFENNMAYNVPETFMSIHGKTYYKVYDIKKNILKFTRIIDKLKYKLKYHKKNVNKIIGYCLEIYGN